VAGKAPKLVTRRTLWRVKSQECQRGETNPQGGWRRKPLRGWENLEAERTGWGKPGSVDSDDWRRCRDRETPWKESPKLRGGRRCELVTLWRRAELHERISEGPWSFGWPRRGIPQGRLPTGTQRRRGARSTHATLRIAADNTLKKAVTPREERGTWWQATSS